MIKNALSFVGFAAVLSASSLVACGGDTAETTTGSGGAGGSTTSTDASTTGSGGDGAGGSTTGTGGTSAGKAYGSLSYNDNTSYARFSKTELEGDGAGCSELANEAGCVAYRCLLAVDSPATVYAKAGAITAKLGAQTLTFIEDDGEFSQSSKPFESLTPGETITTTVAGDEVPAFTHSFKVPGAPTFTAPAWLKDGSTAEQTFDTTKAVDIAWTTVDADLVDISLLSAGSAAVHYVTCKAPASALKLTIPASMMGTIAVEESVGGGVVVGVSRIDETVTSSGVSLKATASHFVQAQASFE